MSPAECCTRRFVRNWGISGLARSWAYVVMDCIGFRRKTRDEIAALTGAPTLVANLLVARVAAELLGR